MVEGDAEKRGEKGGIRRISESWKGKREAVAPASRKRKKDREIERECVRAFGCSWTR